MNAGGFASAVAGRIGTPTTQSSQQQEKDRAIAYARQAVRVQSDPNIVHVDLNVVNLAQQYLRVLGLSSVLLAAIIAGCAPLQTGQVQATAQQVQDPLKVTCDDVVMAANVAGLVPGVGAIVPYVTTACNTADGLAKIAADPQGLEWLGTLKGKIQSLALRVGVKVS